MNLSSFFCFVPPRWSAMRRRSLLPLAAIGLVCCRPVAGQTPIPDDGLDDAAALQASIDAQAQMGGGVVQLEAGTYAVSQPIFLRDGVTLAGRGASTMLSNAGSNGRSTWQGVIVFAGNIAPVSYSGTVAHGYPGRPATREGERALSVDNCGPSELPAIGTVLWVSSRPVSVARRHSPISRYQEMNLVRGVEGCTIKLDAPISAPSTELIWVHWPDGSAEAPPGTPQNAIRDAGLRDLSLSSMNGSALTVSGCYRCRFTGLTIERSRRLLGVQGSRGSLYEGIRGRFLERGIEFAMYATENTVRDVDAEYVPAMGWSPRPAIRFGEYANNNVVSNVRLRLSEAHRGEIMIRFDESYQNRLERVELDLSAEEDGKQAFGYRGEGAPRLVRGTVPRGTTLDDVSLCWTADDSRRCSRVE